MRLGRSSLIGTLVFDVWFSLVAASSPAADQPSPSDLNAAENRNTPDKLYLGRCSEFRGTGLLVVLIGGFDSDPTPDQIAGQSEPGEGNSGLYDLGRELIQHERISCQYFNWNGTGPGQIEQRPAPAETSIVAAMRWHLTMRPNDRLAIVGNSWGGHTAVRVLEELMKSPEPLATQTLILLDAGSVGRNTPPPQLLPTNVCRIRQYATRNLFVWGELPRDRRLIRIDMGNPANGFPPVDKVDYARLFDLHSHIAVEWDPRVHQAVTDLLLQDLPAVSRPMNHAD